MMNRIAKEPLDRLGYDFIPREFLPEGKDEHHLRFEQNGKNDTFRGLTAEEVALLTDSGNVAEEWGAVLVSDPFDPRLVRGCRFHGLIRIGALRQGWHEHHGLRVPVGLYNSTIVSSDIGAGVAIDRVAYLGHYIVGEDVILLNIGEMLTTDLARFGNGIVKAGEREEERTWLHIGNENGGRRILPFEGILPADAWLWSKYREDERLQERLVELTDGILDDQRGWYGTVGERTVIRHCGIVRDVKIGTDACIAGATRLENLTISSDAGSGTRIGEGCSLVNGIIGYGCHIYQDVKAIDFVTGANSNLESGARFFNSVLGDNSTVACAEVQSALIFPGHEQHHSNSFLIASTIGGQSNIAAGATIGSNHNSRAPDGEIITGRGFWPGLMTSLKHNCRFASFTLIAKGQYPYELDIPLPFSLVSNNASSDHLQVMPAYWFLYNMYALARNSWKYAERDRREHREQHLEPDHLAPDTIEEIFTALGLIEEWVGRAAVIPDGVPGEEGSAEDLRAQGRSMLDSSPDQVGNLTVLGEEMENSRRPVVILKAAEAWRVYREMIHLYAVETLLSFMEKSAITSIEDLGDAMEGAERSGWLNAGGQIVPAEEFRSLRERIAGGELTSWDEVHTEYDTMWKEYPEKRAEHAWASLLEINRMSDDRPDQKLWMAFLSRAAATGRSIAELTVQSRQKDYTSPFRRITYDSREEMDAVLGTLDEDTLLKMMESRAGELERRVGDA
ncbi:DUF4954 family protein [Candidatus Zixiibacteriota bacterium]